MSMQVEARWGVQTYCVVVTRGVMVASDGVVVASDGVVVACDDVTVACDGVTVAYDGDVVALVVVVTGLQDDVEMIRTCDDGSRAVIGSLQELVRCED